MLTCVTDALTIDKMLPGLYLTGTVITNAAHEAMKRQTFETTVPFAGFYHTIHEWMVDNAEETMLSDINGNAFGGSLFELFYQHCDYCKVYQQYAADYVLSVRRELAIPSLSFVEMESPREYNFTTDRIFATISRQDLASLLRRVGRKRLQEKIRERFTSGPGFISSYPNTLSEWPPIEEWDHNHVGTVLEALWTDRMEDGIAEDLNSSGTIENWLYDATSPEGLRAVKIADYLRERQERHYRAHA